MDDDQRCTPVRSGTGTSSRTPRPPSAEAGLATHREHAEAVLALLGSWLECGSDDLAAAAKAEVLRSVQQATARLAALRLQLLSAADDAAHSAGHRDVASWLAVTTHDDVAAARAAQRTARGLRSAPETARALRSGAVSERHAAAIVEALDRLPAVTEEVRRRAEERLVEHARDLSPRQLAARGKGILDEVDPAHGEHLGATLAGEASRAWAATTLTFRDHHDGTTGIHGLLPTPVASRIRSVLHAFTSPRAAQRPSGPAADDPAGLARTTSHGPVSHAAAVGQAFCTLLERLDPATLPRHGGAATTVIVTIDHRQLDAALGTALLLDSEDGGGGTSISAGEARRLACSAGMLPAVLGSGSQVLDLGRRARLFSPAQVTALRVRDRGCRAEGCTIPADWCEAHHLEPWSAGGRSDLSNGILLCSFHHHLVHDATFTHRRLPDGAIRFRRGADALGRRPAGTPDDPAPGQREIRAA